LASDREGGSSPVSMAGKTCLITGATAGIGEVAAREIAGLGARLIIVGRDRSRCQTSIERIRAAHPQSRVEAMVADLGSRDGVVELAREFLRHHDRLDVLVNNAGAIFYERGLNRDGIEQTLALNHLAYFGLTCLLSGMLTQSAPSRIVNVASGAHWLGRFDFDDPGMERNWSGYGAYARSKLANILFTRELARRLAGTGVTANSLHPGNVATRFGSNNANWRGWVTRLFLRLFGVSSATGARTVVHLASSPEVEGVTGRYFYRCAEGDLSPAAQDDKAAVRLWEISENLTGLRLGSAVADPVGLR